MKNVPKLGDYPDPLKITYNQPQYNLRGLSFLADDQNPEPIASETQKTMRPDQKRPFACLLNEDSDRNQNSANNGNGEKTEPEKSKRTWKRKISRKQFRHHDIELFSPKEYRVSSFLKRTEPVIIRPPVAAEPPPPPEVVPPVSNESITEDIVNTLAGQQKLPLNDFRMDIDREENNNSAGNNVVGSYQMPAIILPTTSPRTTSTEPPQNPETNGISRMTVDMPFLQTENNLPPFQQPQQIESHLSKRRRSSCSPIDLSTKSVPGQRINLLAEHLFEKNMHRQSKFDHIQEQFYHLNKFIENPPKDDVKELIRISEIYVELEKIRDESPEQYRGPLRQILAQTMNVLDETLKTYDKNVASLRAVRLLGDPEYPQRKKVMAEIFKAINHMKKLNPDIAASLHRLGEDCNFQPDLDQLMKVLKISLREVQAQLQPQRSENIRPHTQTSENLNNVSQLLLNQRTLIENELNKLQTLHDQTPLPQNTTTKPRKYVKKAKQQEPLLMRPQTLKEQRFLQMNHNRSMEMLNLQNMSYLPQILPNWTPQLQIPPPINDNQRLPQFYNPILPNNHYPQLFPFPPLVNKPPLQSNFAIDSLLRPSAPLLAQALLNKTPAARSPPEIVVQQQEVGESSRRNGFYLTGVDGARDCSETTSKSNDDNSVQSDSSNANDQPRITVIKNPNETTSPTIKEELEQEDREFLEWLDKINTDAKLKEKFFKVLGIPRKPLPDFIEISDSEDDNEHYEVKTPLKLTLSDYPVRISIPYSPEIEPISPVNNTTTFSFPNAATKEFVSAIKYRNKVILRSDNNNNNIEELIPNGKLRYMPEQHAFLRYHDYSQAEMFLKSLESDDEFLNNSDLSAIKKAYKNILKTGSKKSKQTEMITLPDHINFTEMECLEDVEKYIFERRLVDVFVPCDFARFYGYVTGFQIYNKNPPISLRTFLTMYNTNRLMELLRKYLVEKGCGCNNGLVVDTVIPVFNQKY